MNPRRLLTFAVCSYYLLTFSIPLKGQPDAPSGKPLPTQQTFVPASELDVVIAGDAEGVPFDRAEFVLAVLGSEEERR